MSHARGIALALLLSLALHVGLVMTLRGLGLGPRDATDPLPPLFVELVEPVVALSGPPRSAEPARAPRGGPRSPRAAPLRPEAPASSPAPRGEPPAPPPAIPSPAPSLAGLPPVEAAPPPPPPALGRAEPAPGPPVAPAEPAPVASVPPAPEPESATARVASGEGALPGTAQPGGTPGPAAAGGEGRFQRRAASGGAPGDGSADGEGRGAGAESGTRRGVGELAALPGNRGTPLLPEYDAYVQALRRRIQERLQYPSLAVRRGLRGTVELELLLAADGRLDGVTVVGGEAAEVLREAAIRAVRDATPFPFAPGLAPRAIRVRLPVRFELR